MAVSTDVDLDRLGEDLDRQLARADAALARQFPGDRPGRQPVHTVYVPADRYRRTAVPGLGRAALATLDEHRSMFAALVDEQGADAVDLETRVRSKLASEPIEDLRIDFEDGYGARSDEVEDGHAASAARELATSIRERDGRTVPRHPDQEPRSADAAPRPAHARPWCGGLVVARSPLERLRHHAAQGHQRRPGRAPWCTSVSSSSRRSPST